MNKGIYAFIKAGILVIKEAGDLPGFDTLWQVIYRDGIANVLSFQGAKAKKGHYILGNSKNDVVFKVTTPQGYVWKFIPSSSNKAQYYANFSKDFGYIVQANRSDGVCFTDEYYKHVYTAIGIEPVESINKSKFSKQDVIAAFYY